MTRIHEGRAMTALDDLATIPFHDADAPQRARMLSRLADTELSVALVREPLHDQVELKLFDLDGARMALACDSEDRLADFFGHAIAYAAMPGRVLSSLLKVDGAGLLVNPGHPSEMMLDAPMLDWLTGALENVPQPDEARMRLVTPASGVVAELAPALADRLADMRGLIAG
ncbi:MAG: SseB family protein, partial [Paracoccus sp. (in: a-proteobacteria)]|nr:SseB family protein [Paracoccus sp. (in: a-proteobacteria)]